MEMEMEAIPLRYVCESQTDRKPIALRSICDNLCDVHARLRRFIALLLHSAD